MNLISINFIAMLFMFTAACAEKEPPAPEFNISGIKTTISRIQISPLAHDGAKVVIAGFVKSIESGQENSSSNLLILSDIKNNNIEIEYNSDFSTEIGEQVVVGGLYRMDLNRIVDAEIYRFIVEDNVIKPLKN